MRRATRRISDDALTGVGHEVDDQLAHDDVEGVVLERQRLRGGEADRRRPGRAARASVEEGLRGIDAGHLVGAEASGQLADQGTRAATDIERGLASVTPTASQKAAASAGVYRPTRRA